MSDQQLLREYLDEGSEEAFQSLVRRHVDLVYSTALRRLCDTGLAEEVTQNVFVALARKAPFLNRDIGLAGWLYKATLLEARHCQRAELRRKRREETAVAIGTTMKEEDSLLKSLSPVLDEALMELPEKDRHAVLLRFFENRNFREVGEALGFGAGDGERRAEGDRQVGNPGAGGGNPSWREMLRSTAHFASRSRKSTKNAIRKWYLRMACWSVIAWPGSQKI